MIHSHQRIEEYAWQMTAVGKPFTFVKSHRQVMKEEEVLIKVAGCGVCHTDLSFWQGSVTPRHDLPLVLGHEISGIVLEGQSELVGKPVIIPAVLPCGECDLCKKGRSNICQNQKMPGNNFDGGFASHVVVPSHFLAPVPEKVLEEYSLEELAVIADAVSTPYQVVKKSHLQPGEFAIIIGVGGIGVYAAQIAHILKGKVLAIDISQERLDRLSEVGITSTLNNSGLEIKEIRKRVKGICRQLDAPPHSWKIYEMSGSRAGQELAYALLGIAGTLSIVGFTMGKLNVRLSNLMAFDAQVIGTWGCKPELYPEVINLVADRKLKLKPFTETFPMSQINEVFQQTLDHKLQKRSVLIPDLGNS